MDKRVINLAILTVTLCLLLAGIGSPNMLVASVAGGIIIGVLIANRPTDNHQITAFFVCGILVVIFGFIGGAFTAVTYGNHQLLLMSIGLAVGGPLGIVFGLEHNSNPTDSTTTTTKETSK